MTENNNNILNDEIREQIKTDDGFKMFVAINIQEIKKAITSHDTDIKELKSWKDKMYGMWWAIIGIGIILAIFGVKLFVK